MATHGPDGGEATSRRATTGHDRGKATHLRAIHGQAGGKATSPRAGHDHHMGVRRPALGPTLAMIWGKPPRLRASPGQAMG